MSSIFTTTEKEALKPVATKFFEAGIEQGIEQGVEISIRNFIPQNPDWTDERIALSFGVEEEMVRRIRASLK